VADLVARLGPALKEALTLAAARLEVQDRPHLLVACSGGPDSTALLDLLCRLAPEFMLRLSAASLNHGLRPEAHKEVDLVRRLAKDRGLPFVSGRAEAADYPRGRPSQAGARRVRLGFLEKVRQEVGADLIALGHTADDQAETILMNLIRGSGLTGLSGMSLVRGRLIRPLLAVARADVLAYLQARNLPFAQDPSNLDLKYLRVRVRHQLLPDLARLNPRIVEALGRLAKTLGGDQALLDRLTEDQLERLGQGLPGGLSLDRSGLARLDPALARRVVRAAYGRVKGDLRRLSAGHVEQVLACLGQPGAEVSLPARIRALVTGRQLILAGPGWPPGAPLRPVKLKGPGLYELSTGGRLSVETISPPPRPGADPLIALLDADKIEWPLLVRSPLEGDRIKPLGMTGSKKVARLMIDGKVERHSRPLVPVILSQDRVVWVAGLCLSRLAALEPQTKTALKVWYLPPKA